MIGRIGFRGPRHSNGRGQSLAEFAIVAPIFFLLVFSVIQLGLVLAAQNGLVDGVRSAARRAATYRINEGSFDGTVWPAICTTIGDEIDTRLKTRVIGYNPNNLTKDIRYEWVQDTQNGAWFLVAHITAWYKNQLYVPLVSWFFDNSDGVADSKLKLSATEQMRVENPALSTPGSTVAKPCP